MYATTPVVDNKMKILALNAATGARIWETTFNLGSFKICCGPVNRGVAVAYGSVYFVTLDDKLVALDAKTGKSVFETTVADPSVGFSETLAPQVYKHHVIIGSTSRSQRTRSASRRKPAWSCFPVPTAAANGRRPRTRLRRTTCTCSGWISS
jgi:outer membrane protein assembly factor BamB